ncbi:MAG: hypothetical protein ABIK65_11695 [Candidatus Eisenbacteria bacterium]
MDRRAVIDIGSNSVKLLVADLRGGRLHEREDRVIVTRLSEGLRETGRIGGAAARRTMDALRELREAGVRAGAGSFIAAGTQALRRAANAPDIALRIRRECGLDVEILSGDEEARLSWVAALSGLADPSIPAGVFDTGGASTEFVMGKDGRIEKRFSFPVGVRGPTEEFGTDGPATKERVAALVRSLSESLAPLPPLEGTLIGVGGTVLTLASVMTGAGRYDPTALAGALLSRAEVDRQVELYRSLPAEGRGKIPGMVPGRADVMLAGAAIVRVILDLSGKDRLLVSARGLRHGLLLDRYSG